MAHDIKTVLLALAAAAVQAAYLTDADLPENVLDWAVNAMEDEPRSVAELCREVLRIHAALRDEDATSVVVDRFSVN
jgi:hypothetical protein